jgi:hypothetical protein
LWLAAEHSAKVQLEELHSAIAAPTPHRVSG